MRTKSGLKIKSLLMVHWGCRRPPLYVGIDAGPIGGRDPCLLICPSEGVFEDLRGAHVPVVIVSDLRIVGDQNL